MTVPGSVSTSLSGTPHSCAAACFSIVRLAAQRQLESDHEAGPQGEAALEERPPGQRHRVHRPPPLFIAAALWMAARRRWYVPQRQMLPAIASSMSASVGFAFRASSAAADMICPDWQ